MHKHTFLLTTLIGTICLVALSGCGVTTSSSQAAASNPQSTKVVTPLPIINQTTTPATTVTVTPASTNTTTGTTSGTQIIITTDHSVYSTSEVINFTITNGTNAAIYAFDTKSSCTIVTLEQQNGQNWTAATATACSMGRPAVQVQIQAGKSYSGKISAGIGSIKSTPLPTGNYRLSFTYSTSSISTNDLTPVAGTSTMVFSATFQVQ